MFDSIPGLPQFLAATMTGCGHLLGQRLMGYVLKRFSRTTTPIAPNDPLLLRNVGLDELKDGIPDGFRLCRFHGTELVETCTDQPPLDVEEGDTLWLVPAGELVLSTAVPLEDATAEADFVVEFDPGEALGRLLAKGDRLDRGALGEVVAAGLVAALTLPGSAGWKALLQGDRKALGALRTSLDRSLRNHGMRCNQVRKVRPRPQPSTPPAGGGDKTDQEYLEDAIGGLKTEADWRGLRTNLVQAGIPLDDTANQGLAALREATLQQALAPAQAVDRLAGLTAAAFERAGVPLPDLVRWQHLQQRVNEEDGPEAEPNWPGPVGVAVAKSPSTWWVWNPAEVDRRRQLFVRRCVEHCGSACDQALATLRDLAALRQVRSLREQLTLVRELLDTMPPLAARKGGKVKELLDSLEQAVAASDKLATQTRRLLAANPAASQWQEALHESRQAVQVLIQNLNDRRDVR